MKIIRFLGWLVLVLGMSLLVYQATLYLGGGVWRPIAIGQLWYDLSPASLNLSQAVVQRHLHPDLWTDWLAPVLRWNAVRATLILGALLVIVSYFSGRRKPRPPAG